MIHTKSKLSLFIVLLLVLSAIPLYSDAYYHRGRSNYVHRNYDKAKEMFLKSVEKTGYGDSYYFLGEIEKIQGNFKESEKYFKEAVSTRMTRKYKKNAYWNLIVLAQQRSDYSEVVRICREMWKKMRSSSARKKVESLINKHLWSDNKDAIAKYKKGLKLKKRRKHEKANKLFKEALNFDPGFLAPKFELGMWAYNNNNLSEASHYLNEIATKVPFYAEVHLILADIHFNRKYFKDAIVHFDQALEFGFISRKTEYIIRVKRGTCHYSERDFEKAKEDIEAAVKIRKKSAKPFILLSAIYIKEQDYDRALTHLRKANQLSKNNPMILFQIGSIYYKKNDWRFLSYFDKLFNLVKKDQKLLGKYNKAATILAKEHFKKKNYRRVKEIITTLPQSNLDYEISLMSAKTDYFQKKYDNAIDIFEKLSLQDDDKLLLCRAYARSGRKEKAEETLIPLLTNDTYLHKARKDRHLAGIVRKIEVERKKREEEERKLKEEEERLEKERLEKERLERERLEKERLEKERLERERLEETTRPKQ